jgi:hypothetical protein
MPGFFEPKAQRILFTTRCHSPEDFLLHTVGIDAIKCNLANANETGSQNSIACPRFRRLFLLLLALLMSV